jgi:DNA-directed RNA polymerase specialized sigma24 family protein
MRGNAEELLAALGEGTAEAVEVLPAPEATNDNCEEAAIDLRPLTDPEVTRAIRSTLYKRGIAGQDLDDGVAEVQTRVLELLRVGSGPQGLAEWRALGNRVAAAYAVDEVRKRYGRAEHEDGLCEDPDACTDERYVPLWDPVDARRMLDVFADMLEAGELPPLTEKIMACRAHGMSDAEIAEDLDTTRDVVVKRRRIARGTFVWRLEKLGMGSLVPGSAQKSDGEVASFDDLPVPLPNRRG